MQNINEIVDELIEKKGLGKLDDDKKALLREKLAEELTLRVNEAIIYRLPEESYKQVEQIVEAEGELDEGRLARVVRDAGLNLGEIAGGAVRRFREAFLGLDLRKLNAGSSSAGLNDAGSSGAGLSAAGLSLADGKVGA